MDQILRRERDLACRFDGCFSLLVLTPGDPPAPAFAWPPVLEVLRERLRFSDEVGWLDEPGRRLGILMHRTQAEKAWNVADEILAALPPEAPPPACEVRFFPSDPGHDDTARADKGARPARGRPVLPVEPLLALPMTWAKRALDIAASGLGLLLLAPLFLVIAATIKLTSSGPVFYSQPRRGWRGRRFVIHKFRSMTTDADQKQAWLMSFNEQDGPAFKMKNDPRVTRVGSFLRKTSLDELPQLWNVFRGDMSLVGPRPLVCPEADSCAHWQRIRLDVTPGITGIWQVHGRRDDFDGWMRMDVRYVRTRRLLLDLKLLWETVPVVLLGRPAGF